ncbi:MAG: hypothetical protein ABIN18_09225 [Pseudomonadota bacterium]
MKNLLYPFEREIRKFSKGKHHVIDEAILMWKIFYYVVDKYRKDHPKWIFKKHEDLSKNPIKEFPKYFRGFLLITQEQYKRKLKHSPNLLIRLRHRPQFFINFVEIVGEIYLSGERDFLLQRSGRLESVHMIYINYFTPTTNANSLRIDSEYISNCHQIQATNIRIVKDIF